MHVGYSKKTKQNKTKLVVKKAILKEKEKRRNSNFMFSLEF
jgi:hypothetical protein